MYETIKISKKTFTIYTLLLLMIPILGWLYLVAVQNYPEVFMPCMLKVGFHLYCPGCGGTHALNELMHFHILASLCANPLVLYGVIVLLYYWFRFLITLIKEKGQGTYRMNLAFIWGLLILMVLLLVVRNLLVVTGIYDYSGELINYWI